MLSCLPSLDLYKMCERPLQEFFPGLLCMDEFFSLIFPLHEFFFYTSPPPPPPAPPIRFLMVRSDHRKYVCSSQATHFGQVVLFPDQETWMVFKIALFKLFITVFEVYMR